MTTHQTFTSDPILAFVVGQGKPPSSTSSFNFWEGSVATTFTARGNFYVHHSVTLTNGQTRQVDAEVFGQKVFDASGRVKGVRVEMVEWSESTSDVVLSRLTFDRASNGQFVEWGFDIVARDQFGIWDFLNPYEARQDANGNTIPAPTNPTALFSDIYSQNDTLTGGAAGDLFFGLNGADTITGGGGQDVLNGDAGSDTFIYRRGDAVAGEKLNGGTEVDKLVAVGSAVVANGILQSYAVDVSSIDVNSVEEVWVSGTEVIVNVAQIRTPTSALGFNVFVGSATPNVADVLTILGAGNRDFTNLQFRSWGAEDTVGLIGSAAAETIVGTAFDDAIVGNGGADILRGGQGSDNFILDTGDGHVRSGVIDGGTFAGTIDQIQVGGTGTLDLRAATITGIEVLQLLGNEGTLTAAQVAGLRTLSGKAGAADSLFIPITTGSVVHLENLQFQNWDSALDLPGFDPNRDFVNVHGYLQAAGQPGATVYGSSVGDYVVGTEGADNFLGYAGNDRLFGHLGNDVLNGGAGADFLSGGDGVTAAGGFDTVDYLGATAGVTVDLDKQHLNRGDALGDEFDGDQVTIGTVTTFVENVEAIRGSNSNDFLYGQDRVVSGASVLQAGDNVLNGMGGADWLFGRTGNDSLYGGAGSDALYGGLGRDIFCFNTALDGTVDRIGDFVVVDDTIRLENTGVFKALLTTGWLSAAAFYKGPAAHDADDRIIYDQVTGKLFYDADGTGAAAQIQFAVMAPNLLVTNADFQVV